MKYIGFLVYTITGCPIILVFNQKIRTVYKVLSCNVEPGLVITDIAHKHILNIYGRSQDRITYSIKVLANYIMVEL